MCPLPEFINWSFLITAGSAMDMDPWGVAVVPPPPTLVSGTLDNEIWEWEQFMEKMLSRNKHHVHGKSFQDRETRLISSLETAADKEKKLEALQLQGEVDEQTCKKERASIIQSERRVDRKTSIKENRLVANAESFKLWESDLGKWTKKVEAKQKTSKFIKEVMEKLGVHLYFENDTLAGVSFSGLDQQSNGECIIRMKKLKTEDWTFKEILGVEPSFPEWEEFIIESNRRRDILYTMITARSHWLSYLLDSTSSLSNMSESNSADLFDDL